MLNNFMLFSELQKQLSPSPIKSWRLLKQLRDEDRMREPEDWIMQDRKLFVNVPRFIVELEHLGYANMKSDDFKSGDMKSDEIMKLAEELKLISSEITESRIQEEMKSSDFTTEEVKPKIDLQDHSMKSSQQNLKSDDINNSNFKSTDFSDLSREIIETKNELIHTLRGSITSREEDITHLRAVISDLSQQLKTTTQQNAWLTNLLVAPKPESPPESRPAHASTVTDISDEIMEEEDEITHESAAQHDPDRDAGEHTDENDDAAMSGGAGRDSSSIREDEFSDTPHG